VRVLPRPELESHFFSVLVFTLASSDDEKTFALSSYCLHFTTFHFSLLLSHRVFTINTYMPSLGNLSSQISINSGHESAAAVVAQQIYSCHEVLFNLQREDARKDEKKARF
jgi:hypothetical protein